MQVLFCMCCKFRLIALLQDCTKAFPQGKAFQNVKKAANRQNEGFDR